MRVRFWGTRGSIATPGPGTNYFGGNTSCVELHGNAPSVVPSALSPGADAQQVSSRIVVRGRQSLAA